MKCLTLLSLLVLVACNGAGGDSSSSAQSCDGQPILSAWIDDGGLGIDLTGLELDNVVTLEKQAGDFNPLSVTPHEICVVNVGVTGNDCTGTVHVISSVRKNPAAFPFTTACADIDSKTYRYEKNSEGIVFGTSGGVKIQYH